MGVGVGVGVNYIPCCCRLYGRFTMECIMAMMFGESADTYKTEKETFITASAILFTAADERLISLFWLLHC